MSELRALVREILAEELAALRTTPAAPAAMPAPACERVDVHSDAALTAFARELLARANDPQFVRSVQSGQHRFTLAPAPTVVAQPPGQRSAAAFTLVSSVPAEVTHFEKNLLTERDVAAIAADQNRIRLAENTRLTPLARDELRRRGIRIERTQK